MASSIYMGTTGVPAAKTAGEIVALLAKAGARQINQDYDEHGKLVGLKWTMATSAGVLGLYSMPARIEPVYRLMCRKQRGANRDQAERTAWRLILRWVQAQIALTETGMAENAEVFAPYREVAPGVTVWAALLAADAGGGPLMIEGK